MARSDNVSIGALARRCILACAALVAAYFAIPIGARDGAPAVAWRTALTAVTLAALVVAIKRQILRQLDQPDAPLGGLIVSILAGVLLFALADYTVAFYAPAEFAGLRTRLDALYFALTTLVTVGYGDISARGQVARGLLCVQMLFNVVVIAAAGSLLAHQIAARARARRS